MEQPFSGSTYWIETFGCQMNVRDSEHVAGLFSALGFQKAESALEADCILFNTCCVRDHAEKRLYGNIGALREWKETRPSRILGVFGCMMQQEGAAEKLCRRFPYVDIVFGTALLSRLPEFLREAALGGRVLAVEANSMRIEENLPSIRGGSVNAFVNINFGCNNYCTYCIVPYVRGPERSRAPEAIEEEVRRVVAEGCGEVTLLGQNVNSYGHDLQTVDFSDLLCRVSAIEGLKRLRFMTSHPKDLSDKLIDTMASLPNVCHHVHLPLQSGSDRILDAMNRRYTRARYLDTVQKLRQKMHDVELTTDIIVGFPGESEQDFSDTLDVVRAVGYANAFTFKYSPRTGTRAASMPDQIPEALKRERLQRLNALQDEMTKNGNERYLGYTGEVLAEGADERGKQSMAYGKYANFKMVYFPGDASMIGQLIGVRVTGSRKSSLTGERLEENHAD